VALAAAARVTMVHEPAAAQRSPAGRRRHARTARRGPSTPCPRPGCRRLTLNAPLHRPLIPRSQRLITMPVCCVPRTARRRGSLRTASARVPFCAAGWMAMAVGRARCSAPGRVCSIAGSRTVDSAHRFGCRMRICVLWDQAWRCPCLLELHAPQRILLGLCPTWL
jgi:hypothetical protein